MLYNREEKISILQVKRWSPQNFFFGNNSKMLEQLVDWIMENISLNYCCCYYYYYYYCNIYIFFFVMFIFFYDFFFEKEDFEFY